MVEELYTNSTDEIKVYSLDTDSQVMMVDRSVSSKVGQSFVFDDPQNRFGRGNVSPVRWGQFDNFPQWVNATLGNDPDAMPTLDKCANFILGGGVYFYKEQFENDKIIKVPTIDKNWYNFIDKFDEPLDDLLDDSTNDFCWYGNYFAEFVLTRNYKVFDFQIVDPHDIRPMPLKRGDGRRIREYHISGNKGTVPAFDPKNPRKCNHFIIHGRKRVAGNKYFGVPIWYGSSAELKLKKLVLEAQIAGLENGWSIKYQLEIHEDFYDDCGTPKEEEAKRKKLVKELNDLMRGVDRTNNVLVTRLFRDHLGKVYSGVNVKAINNTLIDKAASNLIALKTAGASARYGLDAVLAGTENGGGMNSGADTRAKMNYHTAINTPRPRKAILKIFKAIGLIEGFDTSVKSGFRDVYLTTTDNDPKGIQNAI